MNIKENYKKLKQSDRMELLAIDSFYANKGNSYEISLFILLGIKLLIFLLLFEVMEKGDLKEFFLTPMWVFLVALFFALIMTSVEILLFFLKKLNDKARIKRWEEFMLDRGLK